LVIFGFAVMPQSNLRCCLYSAGLNYSVLLKMSFDFLQVGGSMLGG